MKTVHEVSRLTGVSVRTLHHYDAIGLLKPARTTDAGYRLYDDAALKRLQNILIFRELQFPLKEIKAILDSPEFDPKEALEQQIGLLELRRKHIDELIAYARRIQKEGEKTINFSTFNKEEINRYKEEVRERWGSTQIYKEYEKKTKNKTDKELGTMADKLLSLFAEIGSLRKLPPDAKEVQAKIMKLQKFITDHYYTCTNEILQNLSRMYVFDERMEQNIDKAGGEGTARFVKQAVAVYCQS